jgi:hypothetical protein
MSELGHISNISEIKKQQQLLEIKEGLVIEKALNSDDPQQVMKAMELVTIKENETGKDDRKAYYINPITYNDGFGYKNKPSTMSYETLYRMSKTPIINSIIKTRKNQVAAFCRPQRDIFSTGFIIRKRGGYLEKSEKLNKADRARIDEAIDYVLNCGMGNSWDRDSFESFLRKATEDTLIYDQLNFEVVRNQRGHVIEWVGVDPTTIRRSKHHTMSKQGAATGAMAGYNPFTAVQEAKRKSVAGYMPHAVQVYMDRPIEGAEFYPWELSFAVRNGTNRLHQNGYGRSELEDMVTVTTAMLWSDQYNQNFFKLGSSPKGILKIKGGTNNPRLQDFRQRWMSMVAGVENSHRVPVIDSDSAEWIDLQTKNRDMEFNKWQEYNIKLACALYTIDPSEIGFKMSDGENKPMFESNNAAKVKYSKDKGLSPLLKFLEAEINKMVLSQAYPDLVFEFVGVDALTEAEYLDKVGKEVKTLKTLNEVRQERNLPSIDHGDIILDPTYYQAVQAAEMAEQGGMDEMGGMDMGGEEDDESEDPVTDDRGFEPREDEEGDNPFAKAFQDMVDGIADGRI